MEPTATANATATAAPAAKASVHKPDYDKDVVYLYQFGRCPAIVSASPFCLKVETWLRMAGIKYENVDHKMKFKSKKGQLPFVELNGAEIADSDIIIRDLGKHFSVDLDVGLSPEQRTVSHAFVSMLNNHTSWVVRWWRYTHPSLFLKAAKMDIKQTLNSKLPKGVLKFFFKLGFKSNTKQAVGHGLGRHSEEEIYEFGKEDLKALSTFLGDKPYFFGDEPHLLDCVAFANLVQFWYIPFGDFKEFLETDHSNLVAFMDRMRERYWTDWDESCRTLDLNTHLPKSTKEGDEKEEKEVDIEKKETESKDEDLEKEKDESKEAKDNKEEEKQEKEDVKEDEEAKKEEKEEKKEEEKEEKKE